MKKLLLMASLCLSLTASAQTACMFELYCADSIHMESVQWDDHTLMMVKCEDKTSDGIWFTLKQNRYTMFVPQLNTVIRAYGAGNVSAHFICLLEEVRRELNMYFLTQKP